MKRTTSKSLPTVTIAIPAHNEAGNIRQMIQSVLKQEGNFVLEKVIVNCDGCTDSTAKIVREMVRKFPLIELIDDGKRIGKAQRLNQMYDANTSDFLGTFDADVLLDRPTEIQQMLDVFKQEPQVLVVGGRLVPAPQKNLWGRMSVVSYESFEDAARKLNGGNNYYSLVGAASMIRKSLVREIRYPKTVISDMNYLYTVATQKSPKGVRFARDTRFIFQTVCTLRDWRVLGDRSTVSDKSNLVEHFGPEVMKSYQMPKWLYFQSLVKWFIKTPFITFGAVMMNIFIRVFPLPQTTKDGVWETATSTKTGIQMGVLV